MKLRIISGNLGGRQFNSPPGHVTHPMSERIRGAVFNVLGDIKGLTIIDAYAGSGAVAFEAISRGAKHATAIDNDKKAYTTIKQNIETLDIADRITVYQMNIQRWMYANYDEQFEIVVCDPPYDQVLEGVIVKLAKHVAYGGLLVLSWPSHVELPDLPQFSLAQHKTYGNATIAFYKSS